MKRSSEKAIRDLFALYGAFGRPLTLLEILIHIPPEVSAPEEVYRWLTDSVTTGRIVMEEGFYWKKEFNLSAGGRKAQDLYLDSKWKKLQKLSGWFRHIPFFEFVMASGSLSFGNVNPNSDFDVVTGVREGRIFTARYLASALFSVLHARRLDDLQASSPDKLCFNHFITKHTYSKPPHNYYRKELYRSMIPLWCNEDSCEEFIRMNEWSGISKAALLDVHRVRKEKSMPAKFVEWILSGAIGDVVEKKIARPIATKRLSAYLSRKADASNEAGERVIISDEELEFHFVLNYEKKFEGLG